MDWFLYDRDLRHEGGKGICELYILETKAVVDKEFVKRLFCQICKM